MARPLSSLLLALATLAATGSAASETPPSATPPEYSASPPPFYGPAYGSPYAAPPAYPISGLYSPAMLITGIVSSAVGSLALLFGTIAYVNNDFPRFCEFAPDCGQPTHGADMA